MTDRRIPYSTSIKDSAIILEIYLKSAPGSIDALDSVILGADVDPACHTGVSSLRSIIPQCWDFDPTQRPPSSRILQYINITSRTSAILGPCKDQEGETSSLLTPDDSGQGGGVSQKHIAPYREHPLCMNCQQYPKVEGQDFYSKVCLDDASYCIPASAQSNLPIPQLSGPSFAKLGSRFGDKSAKPPKINTPYDVVRINPASGGFTSLSKEWEQILQENVILRQNQAKKGQAVIENPKFSQESAGAPKKIAGKYTATSPTAPSPRPDQGGVLTNSSNATRRAPQRLRTPQLRKPGGSWKTSI
ncbi:signal transducing kinase of the PAK [Tulasnella sp. UAMH 9824]|nr:signal transducing kinase of the PAK [Tulasnella sp. UAMH 9824]